MYTEITDDTDIKTEIATAATAAADMTAAIERLAVLSRGGADATDMASVLSALIAANGPLDRLKDDLLDEGSGWLIGFEDETAELAVDRMEDTAGEVDRLSYNLEIIRDLLNPLAA